MRWAEVDYTLLKYAHLPVGIVLVRDLLDEVDVLCVELQIATQLHPA